MSLLEIKSNIENVNGVKATEEVDYTDDQLREIGKEFCSHGDKVYADP